jgi:hypothetical protein
VYGRFFALLACVLNVLIFYGIQRRLFIIWKFCWAVLVLSFLQFLIAALPAILQSPGPFDWVAAAFATISCLAVTIYWGIWWNRQKEYFSATDS